MITPHTVRIAIDVIDRSDAALLLNDALITTRRGRPRQLTTRAFLIAALLTAMDGRLLTMTQIHVTMMSLDVDTQWDLGIRQAGAGNTVSIVSLDNVEYLSDRLKQRLSSTPASDPHLSDEERGRRQQALSHLSDAILDATLIPGMATTVAIDSTGVWAWAKGKRIPPTVAKLDGASKGDDVEAILSATGETHPISADMDARWGCKTRKDGKLQTYYGYELHAAVNVPAQPDAAPVQIRRISVTAAARDIVAPTLDLIDRHLSTSPIADILVDRHYSAKANDRWASELRQRRINQHLDLRQDDQGFRDHDGIRMAAGWAHCPATPDRLGTIPRPGPTDEQESHAAFSKQIQEREPYALRRVERTNAKGRTRWECPAVAGTLGCPLREGTEDMAKSFGLPIVVNPPNPDTAPKCCTQRTVAIKEATSAKLDQPYYWGSRDWTASYQRRTYVEGFFGTLKNPSTRTIGRGHIQVHGLARTHLLLTIAIAASNVRHARSWHERTGKGPTDHPVLRTAPQDATFAVTLTPEEVAARDAKRHGIAA